jgi:hypothetical protein
MDGIGMRPTGRRNDDGHMRRSGGVRRCVLDRARKDRPAVPLHSLGSLLSALFSSRCPLLPLLLGVVVVVVYMRRHMEEEEPSSTPILYWLQLRCAVRE